MKIGRNDPCPCGSGKKFKKCCIDETEYLQPAAVSGTDVAAVDTGVTAGATSVSDGVASDTFANGVGRRPASTSTSTATSTPGGAALTESLTGRDERLLNKAIQGAKRDRQKRIHALTEEWMGASSDDLLREMSRQGIHVQADKFIALAEKAKSYRKLARSWKLNKRADEDKVTALTRLLWDTLCPQTFRYDEWQESIVKGYVQLEEADEMSAAETWLPWWTAIRDYALNKGFTSAQMLDREFVNAGGQLLSATDDDLEDDRTPDTQISDWLLDLEMVLGNQAAHDNRWAEQRLDYVKEVYTTLPDSQSEFLFQMRRAEGETLFLLKRLKDGDGVYERLIQDFPKDAWSYIGWGDEYSPHFWKDRGIVDIDKAKAIYNRGLENVKEERDAIEDRLRILNNSAG